MYSAMEVMEEAVDPLSQSLSNVRLVFRLPGNDSTESQLEIGGGDVSAGMHKPLSQEDNTTQRDASSYRWEPAPPELTLSASLVAPEASDRLDPDWALLRLSAAENRILFFSFNSVQINAHIKI